MSLPERRYVINPARKLGRRGFLTDLGKGTLAFAVVGLGACSSDSDGSAGTTASTTATTAGSSEEDGGADASSSTTAAEADAGGGSGLGWGRVDFGFVSAYVLIRGTEVAVVDTGTGGDSATIESGLGALGAGWSDVGHVILTHSHGDHVGGLVSVLENAPNAIAYAGAADIPNITAVDAEILVSLSDGDDVFGLEVIATPGHTPGHIAVFDRASGLLVAGDAVNGADGGLSGANPEFTSDMGAADASVKLLAERSVDTVLMGHGEPVVGGAGVLLTDLAASL